MLDMLDKGEIDMSIVKEEQIEFDDYGQNNGNILDNFVSENEFDTIHDSNVTCAEEELNVDWLSNFFDEPLHNNLSSLNPPLTNTISPTNHTHSISKLSTINSSNDNVILESYSPLFNDVTNTSECFGLKSIKSPTLRNANPLLSEVNKKQNRIQTILEKKDETLHENETAIEIIKRENDVDTDEISKCTENTNTSSDIDLEKPKIIPIKSSTTNCGQSQQKLLLFMNTPENRAKLAGANFNIINANLLNKLGNQNQTKTNKPLLNDKPLSVVNVKRCISTSNESTRKDIATKTTSPVTSTNMKKIAVQSNIGTSILLRKDKVNLVNELIQSNILQTIIKKEPENQEVDSGYESPTNSLGSSPLSPPIDVESTDKPNETLQYIDVPPHERQPFYLSEEERRTLVIEGLPVPSGLPLNKMEERALKKVRRKIKNKISAQESRRKKKEYMEALEKKVDSYASENNSLKKKVNNLELANRSLLLQVEKLQAIIASSTSNDGVVEDMDI